MTSERWVQRLRAILTDHINRTMQGVKAGAGGKSPFAWDVVNDLLDVDGAQLH